LASDPAKISTSHTERQNLTMHMQIRRLTRLTNAFSQKWEACGYTICLHLAALQLLPHPQDPEGPARDPEANLTDHVWAIAELLL
jgi:hypothetical protein